MQQLKSNSSSTFNSLSDAFLHVFIHLPAFSFSQHYSHAPSQAPGAFTAATLYRKEWTRRLFDSSPIDGLIFSPFFSSRSCCCVHMSDWELEMQLQHENHIKMMNWVVADCLLSTDNDRRCLLLFPLRVVRSMFMLFTCGDATISQLLVIHLNFCSVWTSTLITLHTCLKWSRRKRSY